MILLIMKIDNQCYLVVAPIDEKTHCVGPVSFDTEEQLRDFFAQDVLINVAPIAIVFDHEDVGLLRPFVTSEIVETVQDGENEFLGIKVSQNILLFQHIDYLTKMPEMKLIGP
jgi:hypothetical protein